MVSAILIAALLGPAPAPALQAHPLVGVWKISYPGGMRIENGSPTVITFTGTLTVEAKGDSLVGNLVTDPQPDAPPRPDVRLATRAESGNVTFVQRSQATINMNGDERKATSISTWTLTVQGDELSGSIERKLEGFEMGSAGPQPLTGKRIKH